jgi:hypothetical protein
MTTRTVPEISLMGLLQRELKKAKEEYAIYHHSDNERKAMYYYGKMDGIEAAIKVLVGTMSND